MALLGGGRMGEALAVGLLDARLGARRRSRSPRSTPTAATTLEARLPGVRVVPSPAWAAADAEVVVVAVKPGDVDRRARSVRRASLPERRARPVDRGRGHHRRRSRPPRPGDPVVRAMPNTGALVGRGAAAIAAGHARHRGSTSSSPSGCSARSASSCACPKPQLDAVTGLSGSGPAYVFLVAEAMIEAGVLVGLPARRADALVRQTLLGAATLLAEAARRPEALRAAVTSPGGTTAAGLAGARGARRARRGPRRGRGRRDARSRELGGTA